MRGTKNKSMSHWKVIEDPQVRQVAAKAAKSIADMNQGVLEAEDLQQEALLLIAGNPRLAERAIMREYGTLYNEVRMDLIDKYVRPLMRSGEMEQRKYRTIPTEDADNEAPTYVVFDDGSGDYTEDAVRLLLPAVWDESYAYGLPARDDEPDHDMPKASANKARGNAHWAYIADIKTGWHDTPLTLPERRAIFLTYAVAWKQKEVAAHQGVSQQAISQRIDSAVKKITARLNGARIEEEN